MNVHEEQQVTFLGPSFKFVVHLYCMPAQIVCAMTDITRQMVPLMYHVIPEHDVVEAGFTGSRQAECDEAVS